MRNSLPKLRWTPWENLCLKVAFEQKIQLKIIAAVLEKSVTSVSKKIKTLGLREKSSKPGRLKGGGYPPARINETIHDLKKMKDILTTYTPFKYSQKAQVALQTGRWTAGKPPPSKKLKKATFPRHVKTKDVSYSLTPPLNYILLEEENFKPQDILQIPGDPLYVSLRHVEEWAIFKGFRQVKEASQNQGISYWKNGRYFSKIQVFLYVNKLRLDKKLPPLHLYEEEIEL